MWPFKKKEEICHEYDGLFVTGPSKPGLSIADWGATFVKYLPKMESQFQKCAVYSHGVSFIEDGGAFPVLGVRYFARVRWPALKDENFLGLFDNG